MTREQRCMPAGVLLAARGVVGISLCPGLTWNRIGLTYLIRDVYAICPH